MPEIKERKIRDAEGVDWLEFRSGMLASAPELAEYEFMEKRIRPPAEPRPKQEPVRATKDD